MWIQVQGRLFDPLQQYGNYRNPVHGIVKLKFNNTGINILLDLEIWMATWTIFFYGYMST